MSRRRPPLGFERLEDRRCLAVGVQMVANLNATNPWRVIDEMVSSGPYVYFSAMEHDSGQLDLWRTDGTQAGTIRLVGLGQNDGSRRQLTDVDGVLYFRGYSPEHGHEMWKSDGTVAGTFLLRDATPGVGSSVLTAPFSYKGRAFFAANFDLMRSNGTSSGTVRVVDLVPDATDRISSVMRAGDTVYFEVDGLSGNSTLYKTNGTAAGTMPVPGVPVGHIGLLGEVNGELYFSHEGVALWKTDGTASGSRLIVDLSVGGSDPYNLTDVNGTLFFASSGQLWKTDGTTAGTVRLVDTRGSISGLFNMAGTLYFSGGSTLYGDGYEPWRSDGTVAGTFMLKDIRPGFSEGYSFSSYPRSFTQLNGQLFFLASDKVWVSDGTEQGTQLFEPASFSRQLVAHQNSLFFSTADAGGWRLLKRDVTEANSVAVERDGPGSGDSDPTAVVELRGALYLGGSNGESGHELWKLDPVSQVMSLVKDIAPGSGGSYVRNLESLRGSLYFTASRQLWVSDGTDAGTIPLATVDVLSPFTEVGDKLFFEGNDRNGRELWVTDGTAAGTMMVVDIAPGQRYEYGAGFYPNSSYPGSFASFQGQLYFSTLGPDGRELWKSDGTQAGTVQVLDIFPGYADYNPDYLNHSGPSDITNFNGTLYFAATKDRHRGLWKTDGTAEGTVLVTNTVKSPRSLRVVDDQLFFVASSRQRGDELWKSDGTAAGTAIVKDIRTGARSSGIQSLFHAEGVLYFAADDGVHGRELWRSDGTTSGTRLVRDIRTGFDDTNRPLSSQPQDLAYLNGVLFFTADDGRSGRELWRTNGTAPGATRVQDLRPGPVGSEPAQLVASGQYVYFSADTEAGRELWRAASLAPVLPVFSAPLTFTEDAPPVLFSEEGTPVDPDTQVLNGGELTVSFTTPYRAGDELLVANQGDVETTGPAVLYRGTVIGRFSGGTGGASLKIALNANVGDIALRELFQSLAFRSISQHPSEARRRVRFDLRDGEGGAATPRYVSMDVKRVNDAPLIGNLGGSNAYPINSPAGILVAGSATVSDVDSSSFAGGELAVSVAGGDVVNNLLYLVGSVFTIDESLNILRRGVIIGQVNPGGGIRRTPLRFTFNEQARPSVVQELLRSISFRTLGSTDRSLRLVTFRLNDGDGGRITVSRSIEVV